MQICECCGQEVRDRNGGPKFGGRIHLLSESILLDGENLKALTKNERFVIECLSRAEGRPVSNTNILNYIMSRREWVDNPPELKVVDVYICKIRKKIKQSWLKDKMSIGTSWGVGYFLELTPNQKPYEPSERGKLEDIQAARAQASADVRGFLDD